MIMFTILKIYAVILNRCVLLSFCKLVNQITLILL